MSEQRFRIRHPGTGDWVDGDFTFLEAYDRWFEGFNLPHLILPDGALESSEGAYAKVKAHIDGIRNARRLQAGSPAQEGGSE